MDLTGHLLIAMPGMGDPRFDHAVVLLCAHSDEGAMGLIINKLAEGVHLGDLLSQLSIEDSDNAAALAIHIGGPVEKERGFVLHDVDYKSVFNTLNIKGNFGLTATVDALEDLARGAGPQQHLVALGYAGWGPGQLEEEIAQNAWLTCDADTELVFDTADDDKWEQALKRLGVDALLLSGDAGHA